MFAIQPPEYLPRLVYCALMAGVDRFVVGDCFQYSRQSYQNRARLRTPDGIQWITVPLVGGQFGQSIRETRVDYSHKWQKKHLKALKFNYASAPFYEHYFPDFEAVFSPRPETLGELSLSCLELIHSQLGLTCELQVTRVSAREVSDSVSTEIPIDISGEISPAGNAPSDVFRHAPGESRLVYLEDEKRIDTEAENIMILSYEHPTYRQNFTGFRTGLSVLDLLFMHGPDALHILRSGITNISAVE